LKQGKNMGLKSRKGYKPGSYYKDKTKTYKHNGGIT
jgi:hypothetical protein